MASFCFLRGSASRSEVFFEQKKLNSHTTQALVR